MIIKMHALVGRSEWRAGAGERGREKEEGAYIAFATALGHHASGVIEDTEHRHQTRRLATSAAHVATSGAHGVGGEADAAGGLGDQCALLHTHTQAYSYMS